MSIARQEKLYHSHGGQTELFVRIYGGHFGYKQTCCRVLSGPVPSGRWPRLDLMNGAPQLPLDSPELSFAAAGDSLVRRTILPSGVRILSEQVPGSRSATIGYWIA